MTASTPPNGLRCRAFLGVNVREPVVGEAYPAIPIHHSLRSRLCRRRLHLVVANPAGFGGGAVVEVVRARSHSAAHPMPFES